MINKLMNASIKVICNPLVQKFLNKVFHINPNNFTLGFKKVNGLWYSDIKNWPKQFEARQQMVCGADSLLEYLAKGKDYITLHIETKPFKNSYRLIKVKEDDLGGTYICDNPNIPYSIWLCNVTKFVMGKHPEDIYFSVEND